jgi:uncharacterized damage-inducible protein DinB
MIPPHILERFKTVPQEIVDLCRPHAWTELTMPPGVGMKPIRDVLVHVVGAEAYWIKHVVLRGPRERPDPVTFLDLDAILSVWTPQRASTLDLVRSLSPAQGLERRPFPWNADESASIEEIVWHVVTHEQYHRGQVFTRLALLGRRDLPDYDLLR